VTCANLLQTYYTPTTHLLQTYYLLCVSQHVTCVDLYVLVFLLCNSPTSPSTPSSCGAVSGRIPLCCTKSLPEAFGATRATRATSNQKMLKSTVVTMWQCASHVSIVPCFPIAASTVAASTVTASTHERSRNPYASPVQRLYQTPKRPRCPMWCSMDSSGQQRSVVFELVGAWPFQ